MATLPQAERRKEQPTAAKPDSAHIQQTQSFLDWFRHSLPFTRASKERRQREEARQLDNLEVELRQIGHKRKDSVIAQEPFQKLVSEQFLIPLSKIIVREEQAEKWWSVLTLASTFAAFLLAPAIGPHLPAVKLHSGGVVWILGPVLSCLPWLVFFVLVRLELPDPLLISSLLVLILAGVGGFYRIYLIPTLTGWERLSALSGSLGTALSTICIFVGAGLATAVDRASKRRPKSPDVLLFREMLSVASDANLGVKGVSTRRAVVSNLDRAAYLLEYSIPMLLTVGDPATDSWVRTQLRERAASMRELSKMVILSNPSEWPAEFVERATTALTAIARRDWIALEHTEVKRLPRPEKLQKLSHRIVRVISVGVVPAALIFLVRKWEPFAEFDRNKGHWLLVIFIVYSALCLLYLLDPGYELSRRGIGLLDKIRAVSKEGSESGRTEK